MRQISESVLCFEWSDESDLNELKIVREYRGNYKGISRILDENPAILVMASRDLESLSEAGGGKRGRGAKYTCENLLRAVIVHTVEGEDLRGTVVRIAESGFLKDFIRLGNRPVMDFTFLDRAFKAIRAETWKEINALLAGWARREGRMDPSAIRVDTTVTETTIHYPTDSSLLWDSWRVLARLLRRARTVSPGDFAHRFHDRKARKAHLCITRYAASRVRRRFVKRCFRQLIRQVKWITRLAEEFASWSRSATSIEAQGLGAEIERYITPIRAVLKAAERAQIEGETVAASERVYSIFEPHTELIRRGRRQHPVEFGHMIRISQTRDKFISDYEVMEHRAPDAYLGLPAAESHERLYGSAPEALCADAGFNAEAERRGALEAKVKTLAIPRKTSDWARIIGIGWQRFRAGIEGTISVLKRTYRLLRCPYKGFKSFASSAGMSVFCHNLVLLARPPGG